MQIESIKINRFLSDPLFVKLAVRDENDPEWVAYQSKYSEETEYLIKARLILLAAERFPKEDFASNRKAVIWNLIQNEISTGSVDIKWERVWPFMTAALVVLVLGIVTWNATRLPVEDNSKTIVEERVIERVNNQNTDLPVLLSDGSTIFLAANSSVRYSESSYNSNQSREIYLSGEAFFEVVPNPEVPFYVYTEGLTTKVLGTSFSVRAFPEEKEIKVQVRTGSVSVFATREESSKTKGIPPDAEILNPDDKLIMDLNTKHLLLEKGVTDERQLPEEEIIDDIAVPEVFSQLENTYGIKINYQKAQLKDCKITAVFTKETFYEKIRLICKGIGAQYHVEDGAVRIESTSCN